MSEKKIVNIRRVKPEIRNLGVDDGVFQPHTTGTVDVIGVVYRGGYWLDGVMRTEVEIDGIDATEKLASMILDSPHRHQLRVILLNGVTLAGFNVVDLQQLFERTGLAVIAVVRMKPDMDEIRRALDNLPQPEKRWKVLENAGEMFEVQTRIGEEPVYMQIAGILQETAREILKRTSTRSRIPESLRVAHIIASGLTRQRKKRFK